MMVFLECGERRMPILTYTTRTNATYTEYIRNYSRRTLERAIQYSLHTLYKFFFSDFFHLSFHMPCIAWIRRGAEVFFWAEAEMQFNIYQHLSACRALAISALIREPFRLAGSVVMKYYAECSSVVSSVKINFAFTVYSTK
jgi:hypothetical protein